ncbi:hypothetical protein scyTo_0019249, partial [Scyliorhinus torazame]|nr:hypothetical protein [Scyliorhinus torazame]
LTVAPKNLPTTLVSADVAANYLTKIYPLTFGQKPNLRSVYLHNNKLTDAGLPDHMFNGSDGVGILIMSSNFLKYVPKNLPKELFRLHLKNNKLEKIPKGAFDNLSSLRELYLHNNYITNDGIDNETFWKLSSLEYLDLSSNNLTQIPRGLPRNIILLHLEKNAIKSIPGMTKLKEIFLSNNKLKLNSVYPGAWKKLANLQLLDLSGNQLSYVPSDLPESLEYIYLQNNQISVIPEDAFESTPNIKGIFLRDNRLTTSRVKETAFAKLKFLQVLDMGAYSESSSTSKREDDISGYNLENDSEQATQNDK